MRTRKAARDDSNIVEPYEHDTGIEHHAINFSTHSFNVDSYRQEEVLKYDEPEAEPVELDKKDIICDEELPSGQNYLHDSSIEGFIPPSPGKGIDGRPPSRNSIRPRYDDSEHAGGRGSSTSTPSRVQGFMEQPASGRPKTARSSRSKSSNNGSNNLSRGSGGEMLQRPSSARSAGARAGRGAERYTNPYDVVTLSSSGGQRGQHAQKPQRGSRSSLEILSRSRSAPKSSDPVKPPFRPSSANAHLYSYERNTKSHASYLKSTAIERGLTDRSHDFLRRSHSAISPPRRRGRSMTPTSSSSKHRRRQSSIDLTRARQQKKKVGRMSTSQRVGTETRSAELAEMMVSELGQSVMQELSKVVNSMSSELQNISMQMRSLTESVSESVTMINMSRDNTFATYNDTSKYGQSESVDNVIEVDDGKYPLNGRADLSDMNHEQYEIHRLQQAMDEDAKLSLFIEEGLRSKLINIIENVMQSEV